MVEVVVVAAVEMERREATDLSSSGPILLGNATAPQVHAHARLILDPLHVAAGLPEYLSAPPALCSRACHICSGAGLASHAGTGLTLPTTEKPGGGSSMLIQIAYQRRTHARRHTT